MDVKWYRNIYFIHHSTFIPHRLIRNHKWPTPNVSGFIAHLVRASQWYHNDSEHIDYVFKKANKWLYAHRLLVRSKLPAIDLIAIYCGLVRSILEYGSLVWAALPEYLSDVVEGAQKKALRIVFPTLAYSKAVVAAGLQTLATRRGQACVKFLHAARAQEPLCSVLTSTASQTNYHG